MFEITILLLILILSFKLRRLNKEVKGLKLNIQELSAKLDLGNEQSTEIASPNQTVSTLLSEKKAKFAQTFSSKSFSNESNTDRKDKISSEKETETIVLSSFEVPVPLKNDFLQEKNKKSISLEMQLGTRLPVWIGGAALMLAGFFFVKYSIDLGLLTPEVRVILGLIFGCTLLMAGNWLKNHPNVANSTQISQALSGAGISDLFVCLFAAHSLYGMLPATLTFLGMGFVTFLAVVLSLKQGLPVALMGLIGGYLTPIMVSSDDPQGILLFTYLYFVFVGLMVVIRKNNWWFLAIPSVMGLFIWVCVWLFGNNYSTEDSRWLILFLITISSTVFAASKQQLIEKSEEINRANWLLNYLTIIGVLILTSIITSISGFGFMDWGLFGLLSFSSIMLAHFNQKLYSLAPWLSMVVTALMLFSWDTADANAFALIITSFGSLFIISSVLVHFHSAKPQLWIGLASITSLVYYLLGYYELRHSVFGI
ncbi:MAG: DUF2339 domain-containing protein [Parachlamydiaceae bacterium]|nr:DUF2339 domain-containing protein [Parachlamydiaceae bacterium]